jgi:putative hydrolase of the HAD superfamily
VTAPPFAVTHVLFDVDGTLVDFDAALRGALAATAAHIGTLIGAPVSAGALQVERDRVVAEHGDDGTLLAQQRVESLRRVLASHGIEDAGALEETARVFFGARNDSNRAFDDVEETLAAVTGAGLTVVAATNGNATLDGMTFMRHVSVVHRAEEVGLQKPDPRFFTSALERAGGGDPARAVSVGDRYEHDYAPAVEAGMHAIWLDREGAEDAGTPELVRIESLVELPALLGIA